MSAKIRARPFGKLAALAAVAALGALAIPLTPANAQPYLGWDFGGGIGIGIGIGFGIDAGMGSGSSRAIPAPMRATSISA